MISETMSGSFCLKAALTCGRSLAAAPSPFPAGSRKVCVASVSPVRRFPWSRACPRRIHRARPFGDGGMMCDHGLDEETLRVPVRAEEHENIGAD